MSATNQKAVFDLAISAGMLVSGAGMFIAGAMGMTRHRPTIAALYLDARVWWSRNLGAGRAKQLADEASAQAARRAEAVQIRDDGSVALYSEKSPGSGLEVYSWHDAVSGALLCAVGPAGLAYCPRTLAELGAFEPTACPFVLLTYISARGEERTVPVDPRLWYRRRSDCGGGGGPGGVPKFTADEVHYLLCRDCPENASVWTPEEYTLECTTAENEDLVLSQKQVFWTVPRLQPSSPQQPHHAHHHPPVSQQPAAAAAAAAADDDELPVDDDDDVVEMTEEETEAAATTTTSGDEANAPPPAAAAADEKATGDAADAATDAEMAADDAALAEDGASEEEEDRRGSSRRRRSDNVAMKRVRDEEEDSAAAAIDDLDASVLMPPPKKLPRGRRNDSADDYFITRDVTFDQIMMDFAEQEQEQQQEQEEQEQEQNDEQDSNDDDELPPLE